MAWYPSVSPGNQSPCEPCVGCVLWGLLPPISHMLTRVHTPPTPQSGLLVAQQPQTSSSLAKPELLCSLGCGGRHARTWFLFEPRPTYWAATLCRALCWAFHVLMSSNRHDKKHLNSEKELASRTDRLTRLHLGNHKGDLWVTGSWNSPRGSTGEGRAQLHFKYLHYRRECVKSDKASTAQPAEPENTSY